MEMDEFALFNNEIAANKQVSRERLLMSRFFSEFDIYSQLDSYGGAEEFKDKVYLPVRAKINEIISVDDIVISLSKTGVCFAYHIDSRPSGMLRRIACLNISADEIIRNIYYNKSSESLITVSVFKSDEWKQLKVRTTGLESIRQGNLKDSEFIFESEDLQYPGFVEFDDVNRIAMTFCATKRLYKIWSLRNHTLMYSILGSGVKEIKIGNSMLLVICKKQIAQSFVSLKLLKLKTGELMKSERYVVHRGKPFKYIEFHDDIVLLKQAGENWIRISLLNDSVQEIENTEDMNPSAVIYFWLTRRFILLLNQKIFIYDSQCRRIASVDYELYHHDSKTNNIFIHESEEFMVVYCAKYTREMLSGSITGKEGMVLLVNLLTGEIEQRIERSTAEISESACEALNGITCLTMNAERRELVTASEDGHIHVWRFHPSTGFSASLSHQTDT